MRGLMDELIGAGISNSAILVIMDILANAGSRDIITLQSISDRRKISDGTPAHGAMNKVRRSVRELCRAGYMTEDTEHRGRYLAADHPKWAGCIHA